ncbi:MAG TPA: protein kinase [Polyangiales bacterium]|nr:protein kinase [Polyangiales bacterium]
MSPPSTVPLKRTSERAAQRYEVKGQIAHGGMGVVYRALDRSNGQEVALKRVFLKNSSRRALYTSAFEREYQVLASLEHPRIIRVFDYGVDDEGPYYTMELVAGRDLAKAAPLPWREVCLYMRDLAASLSLLHARRLLHRDLSPGNVKIDAEGHAKLLDFGALSDFGFTNWLIGTPPLVPPEALRGDLLDQRADLYALGGLAYWALTGVYAFPANKLDDLPMYWNEPPRPPSSRVPEIPRALDQLVLSLLSQEPLARPASAAEVIVRLNALGQLPLEDEGERRRLTQSFLIVPPFVGRDEELEELNSHLKLACNGQGAAIRIEAMSGSGRSRLLEEIGVRAQLTGATVLRADASMHPNHHGTSRALALRLLDALPDLAREKAKRYAHHLNALGRDVEARLGLVPSRPPRDKDAGEPPTDPGGDLSDWLAEVSHHKPLVITVDNVEFCDAASLGALASLSARVRHESVLLVVAERTRRDRRAIKGLAVLREQCQTLALSNLDPAETLALARSLFGDAPNVERFAEWLHGRTAGSPLHCVEISRQLIAQEVIRHEGGMWILPASRPHVELPEALEGALSIRIANLSPKALGLARCLSLQRGEPTLELCRELVEVTPQRSREQEALILLDELARNDVLHRDQDGYRFGSAALRDALMADVDDLERETAHTRLGRAFETLAVGDRAQLLEAGWHSMRGGDELRGADLIAYVLREGYAVRGLSANGYQLGPIADAALRIYKRHRRGPYERLPLLAGAAQAGYYEEDYTLSERYGDESLDVIEDLAGLRTARRLRRYVGGLLALGIGLGLAFLRFLITPKRERNYPFMELLNSGFSTVVALVGTATMALDADRADRVARVLEPFAVLPDSSTPRGIYDFCVALQQVGREHQPEAFATFDKLAKRFEDPRWYRMLPPDGRPLFVTACHFARGAFAVFRADCELALDSAAVLEASGFSMYAMVAAQLRFFYHAHRGELNEAARQRELVELHAARAGSAWQVELWEPAALLPLYLAMGDLVALSRIVRRFDELLRIAPSLVFYKRLAEFALFSSSDEQDYEKPLALALRELDRSEPRSFIGWTTVLAGCASTYNKHGRYRQARALCERGLAVMHEVDRQYVSLFLQLELQLALADAGLDQFEPALARLDGLLTLHGPSQHPLALGLLHEARARVSYRAGKKREYHFHMTQMEKWFRPTGTPALIAKCERVAELEHPQETARQRPVQQDVIDEIDTEMLEPVKDA